MTSGRRKLLDVLQRTKSEYVARRCRVSRGNVSRWACGLTKPSPEARRLLAVNYDIPPKSWDED